MFTPGLVLSYKAAISSHLLSASARVSPTTMSTEWFLFAHLSARIAAVAWLGQWGMKAEVMAPNGGSILFTVGHFPQGCQSRLFFCLFFAFSAAR